MADFLLELRSEEIPARMQAGARAELEKLFRRELDAAGVRASELTIWSSPRRLALIARGLPLATEAVSEEAKGPPEGAPDAAIDGFCKKSGATREQLELRDVKGRMTYFAVIAQPGRAMPEVLAASILAVIRDFSWPKSMRWGVASITTDSLRWVRPLSGIVALLDGKVVDVEVGGIRSGRETYGHRFHSSGPISIGSASDYVDKLHKAHVIVDHAIREDYIAQCAEQIAFVSDLKLIEDHGLVVENAGLTEWPEVGLGFFDEAFLDVPPEVIQLTARVNQKYFVCQRPDGTLANAFVCTANIVPHDMGVVIDGNRKVLAARLSDARFFWEQDQKTPLEDHAKKLARITFHEKLGTVADKVERVAKLARWLVESDIVTPAKAGASGGSAQTPEVPASAGMTKDGLADMAEQAARLCKADLVTEMVGEFPELQGLMGGYYAAKEGLPVEVADAIRDHYKPVGQGDDVPSAPVTVAVSLADKLDTLVGFYFAAEYPTGSKDPYALRRAAIAVLSLLTKGDLRLPLKKAIGRSLQDVAHSCLDATESTDPTFPDEHFVSEQGAITQALLLDFFADRLKVQQREAGVRHDLIDAVFAAKNQDGSGEDDLVRLLARVHALQAFVITEDGTNLLAGYKRAANILKKEDWRGIEGEISQTGEEDPLAMVDDPDLAPVIAAKMAERHAAAEHLSYTPEPAEAALIAALDAAAPKAAAAVEAERFADAMAALASLRAPIDRFFEEVIVNAEETEKRQARLALLARFRDAVHRVADFSRIEG